uniref:Uncharacterized protein n=1 Tax=Rhizophora mucronata TaxID=61149 RepID=A0A2P2NU35_RHIMU
MNYTLNSNTSLQVTGFLGLRHEQTRNLQLIERIFQS